MPHRINCREMQTSTTVKPPQWLKWKDLTSVSDGGEAGTPSLMRRLGVGATTLENGSAVSAGARPVRAL